MPDQSLQAWCASVATPGQERAQLRQSDRFRVAGFARNISVRRPEAKRSGEEVRSQAWRCCRVGRSVAPLLSRRARAEGWPSRDRRARAHQPDVPRCPLVADARPKRNRLTAAKLAPSAIAGAVYSDPDKALVMTAIGQLVAAGRAEWTMLDDGDVELSFNSGETFILAERVVIRLA